MYLIFEKLNEKRFLNKGLYLIFIYYNLKNKHSKNFFMSFWLNDTEKSYIYILLFLNFIIEKMIGTHCKDLNFVVNFGIYGVFFLIKVLDGYSLTKAIPFKDIIYNSHT